MYAKVLYITVDKNNMSTPTNTPSLERLEAMLHELEAGLASIAERINHLEQVISK